jgi:hypothetical protein
MMEELHADNERHKGIIGRETEEFESETGKTRRKPPRHVRMMHEFSPSVKQ